MPENYQKNNVGKGSKISDLSSKIKEAENDLSVSRGIKLRNSGFGSYLKQNDQLVSDNSAHGSGVSELHVLRLKQIETAQRLKETLRRNVDLMTELQKARGIVRNLEKKLSLFERGEHENSFRDTTSKDTIPLCSHCPKQEEEINKLKMHIIEMNESFQKRWDDTQMELLQAKQSLSDVSRKMLESINNNQLKGIPSAHTHNFNNFEINEAIEENIRMDDRALDISKNNSNISSYCINGSETQSPPTYRFSRPSSSNFSNVVNAHSNSLNSYSLINSEISKSQCKDFIHQSDTPKSNLLSSSIRPFINNNHRSLTNAIKYNRPQSEHLINYPIPNAVRAASNINTSNGLYSTIGSGDISDKAAQIRSLDSITINPGLTDHANSFPSGLGYNFSNRRYDMSSRDLTTNHFSNPFVYPNTYSSNILSQNKFQASLSDSFNSSVDTINSYKTKNSLFSTNENINAENSIIQDQLDADKSTVIANLNSISESTRIQGSICLSPNTHTATDQVKDLTINNSTVPINDNLIEYPPSPATKDSLGEMEADQNTYGNIRKTLEELKKTQDQRVQQLKDDREKLLRAVLNDLQEMKDFKTNLSNIKESQEKMIKTAPKSLFSLEDSSNYENL
ncbi:hypothetical protein OJ253_3185 [Cryptosporidium canis]|uniref:Uncharacterized protein n=1 Tax=Cryptosporidium canis TaxID=195482 RepID=A0A9D5DJ45_9CRYT|nr:hypothetical protein OJ253_3185 [Cryptosporidium canis]